MLQWNSHKDLVRNGQGHLLPDQPCVGPDETLTPEIRKKLISNKKTLAKKGKPKALTFDLAVLNTLIYLYIREQSDYPDRVGV